MTLVPQRFLVVALLAASPAALAFGSYSDDIPNYVNGGGCSGRPPSTGGNALRHDFGADWAVAKGSAGITGAWGRVFDDDSDGDGQTNGQELGDPCGMFSTGGGAAGAPH